MDAGTTRPCQENLFGMNVEVVMTAPRTFSDLNVENLPREVLDPDGREWRVPVGAIAVYFEHQRGAA